MLSSLQLTNNIHLEKPIEADLDIESSSDLANMDNTDPLLNPESLQPHTTPNPNGQIPPQPTRPTMTARMSIFPRAIGERCQGFMYPPKVGMHRRSIGASSSRGSSSSIYRTSATILCGSTFSPPSPNVISPLLASTSHASSLVGSTLPPIPTRFITCSFIYIYIYMYVYMYVCV